MTIDDVIIRVDDPVKPLDCAALYDPARTLEVEVGCGKGRFLNLRAAQFPQREFLGVERMKSRVESFARKAVRGNLANAHVCRIEALYAFHYLLPAHHAEKVYVFFPDPWPKRKHHSHRLFGEAFLSALHRVLREGGKLEFATDHEEYFHVVEECFANDARYRRTEPMPRPPEVWTEFETLFRGKGMEVFSAAWEAIGQSPDTLPPLQVMPDDEPREGIERRDKAMED
ncbi:MAG: tRNA (guanosine(46)-N7)-methyltransferase TrmB [Kiritimatiellae bacterium]|nr:tRNA (guanosine(46)-N7)-methyltransferase TrmB [Kiritimatiellia bacterium]